MFSIARIVVKPNCVATSMTVFATHTPQSAIRRIEARGKFREICALLLFLSMHHCARF
jgi:hypothetical protein